MTDTAGLTPEEIEAVLSDRRATLLHDVEALSARLAPEALEASARAEARALADAAKASARARVEELRERANVGVARLRARVGLGGQDDPLVHEEDEYSDYGSYEDYDERPARFSPAVVRDRVARLFADARDGDPTSLAIVTGAALVLTGAGVVAAVRAVRTVRQ